MTEETYEVQKKDLTVEQLERIENNFTYHAPFDDLPERYSVLRFQAKELAITFCQLSPESRELSLALTNLEQSVMWANAAIARNEKKAE